MSVGVALTVLVVPAWLARGAGESPNQEPARSALPRVYQDIVTNVDEAPEAARPAGITQEKYDRLVRGLHDQIEKQRAVDAAAGRPVGVKEQAEDIDRKIDRLSREVEDLKRLRDRDREHRKRAIERLGKELEDLKREVEAGPKTGQQDDLDDIAYELARKYFSHAEPKRPDLGRTRLFSFFLGAFW